MYDSEIKAYKYTITGTNETNVQQTVTASFKAIKGTLYKVSAITITVVPKETIYSAVMHNTIAYKKDE
ncbi:hypothetical protein FACS189496_3800 [Bacilli bacterium]|nr:hypothetical protein FACS189496_3800 [Bacilli bacterium]